MNEKNVLFDISWEEFHKRGFGHYDRNSLIGFLGENQEVVLIRNSDGENGRVMSMGTDFIKRIAKILEGIEKGKTEVIKFEGFCDTCNERPGILMNRDIINGFGKKIDMEGKILCPSCAIIMFTDFKDTPMEDILERWIIN